MVGEAAIQTGETAREATRRDTFLRLIEQYGPALKRLAGAYLDREADREDLFQEIAVALWQAIPAFRGESSERTWLYRIAHNVAISDSARLRGHRRREEAAPELFDRASAAPDAEKELLREEKRRLLVEAIRELSGVDRQIVLLHLEGLSYAEIEEVSGLSQAALATRLTRAREKLKEHIRSKEGGAYERSR
jgi:RNA polymerase sigma-70 factor (ECF subfamily)